ncbi:MAG: FAD-binding oxidoreductase [Gammaproteobacteria bacterium]|jgi:FAD/FMN-containing dehydrogenase|nr:FAD-binding oxidoreductase [Gammaproteobacteria bacterium]MDH3751530.1 FAD-binding oxidoreductase [Gammaproteobacteria bacterium]MDH3804907.1 FAD-binding oxidoreductase [Gammaproteobacteria bacterium]
MLLDELKAIVGAKGWSDDPDTLEPHLTEWRGRYCGQALIMVSPSTTAQVSEVVSACAEARVAIVPQGGNTGLCGGAIPDDSGEQVLLSLSRLNSIRAIDADDFSIVVEAGCVLAVIQEAAKALNRFFPLSLAAEGSCQIGGNLSTNAGGINVIRYGTARQQVLGLEVVLADGTIWDGLRSLRKDTAGYDMKQLFVGSEGTLGIITAATLKLYPDPGETATVFVALPGANCAAQLLARMREHLSDRIQAFELLSDRCLRFVRRHMPDSALPFANEHPWYVLCEVIVGDSYAEIENALVSAMEDTLISDAIIAKNEAEAERFWRMRHSISEAQKPEGASLKHDISVPIGSIGEFLLRGDLLLESMSPEARLVAFGHVGDGNLHYNIAQPPDADGAAFLAEGEALTEAIYDLVDDLDGSISAEHGIGVLKKDYLSRYRGGAEMGLMRTMKRALDPQNILNPGKVI